MINNSLQHAPPLIEDRASSSICLPIDIFIKLMESFPEGVWIRSVNDRKIIYANPAMKCIGGKLSIEGSGIEVLFSLAHPEDVSSLSNEMVSCPLGNFDKDCRLRMLNGSYRWFNVRSFALHDDKNEKCNIVGVFTDIHARKLTEQQLKTSKNRDILTNLLNRSSFIEQVDNLHRLADQENKVVFLGVLGLNGFRLINDFGRHCGDSVLQQIGKRLQTLFKNNPSTVIGRLSGSEFAVAFLSSNIPPTNIENINSNSFTKNDIIPNINTSLTLQSIVKYSSDNNDTNNFSSYLLGNMKAPFFVNGKPIHVGTNLGLARYPMDAKNALAVLKCADIALSNSRDCEQGGHILYHHNMELRAIEKRELELSLQSAIHNKEFVLFYQPKIDLDTGLCHGVEALVRWNKFGAGFVLPSFFIHALEESGLIVSLGDWVINEACRQMEIWNEQGVPPLRVAINISARQLSAAPINSHQHHNTSLEVTVRKALNKYPKSLLDFELTESTIMSNTDHSIAILQALSDLGACWSIDDFGTGYSSLSYLRRFPVKTIKIDRSFITDMTADRKGSAIVSAIISMAHSLNMDVVAEGVETQEQLDLLINLGCDRVQGHIFCQALPADQIGVWIIDHNKQHSIS